MEKLTIEEFAVVLLNEFCQTNKTEKIKETQIFLKDFITTISVDIENDLLDCFEGVEFIYDYGVPDIVEYEYKVRNKVEGIDYEQQDVLEELLNIQFTLLENKLKSLMNNIENESAIPKIPKNYFYMSIEDSYYSYCEEFDLNEKHTKLHEYKKDYKKLYELKNDLCLKVIKEYNLEPLGFHSFKDRNRDFYRYKSLAFHIEENKSTNNLGNINSLISSEVEIKQIPLEDMNDEFVEINKKIYIINKTAKKYRDFINDLVEELYGGYNNNLECEEELEEDYYEFE